MTVNVVAVITAKEGQQDAVLAAMKEAAPHYHADPGCLLFALHRSGRSKIVVVESYADKEALQRHAESDVFKALGAKTKDLVEGPSEITLCTPEPCGDEKKGAL
ncbi:putative quinol monooxygenase [Nocardioides insulae]|uniref:putative quinol monooxygenase n=1 Tax=Nocardioides insulae TaxID=394734 RepID=UPI000405E493|nr:putative quinol monooxygenase [Nocardioides insulae]